MRLLEKTPPQKWRKLHQKALQCNTDATKCNGDIDIEIKKDIDINIELEVHSDKTATGLI